MSVAAWPSDVWHWWMHLTGHDGRLGWFFSVSGRWYAITSGIGIQFVLVWWRHRNCHQKWCWRIGHHPDPEDPSWRRCSKHHTEAKAARNGQ